MNIILATKSTYKIALFKNLDYAFTALTSPFNEDSFKNKKIAPRKLSLILAKEKALSLKEKYPKSCIIGCDQVLAIDNTILSKPITLKKNIEQIAQLSGKTHILYTAVCIVFNQRTISFVDKTELTMRALTAREIKQYVQKEKAFDCCGGYKIESYGISLFAKIKTSDFTAIQGLPLIKLNQIISTLDK